MVGLMLMQAGKQAGNNEVGVLLLRFLVLCSMYVYVHGDDSLERRICQNGPLPSATI